MGRAHAQPARAARKRTTADRPKSAPAQPARVQREAPYPDRAKAELLRGLSDVAELYGVCERPQLLQALVLDLADPLTGDVERPPDLVERARMLAVEAVAKLEVALLAGAQRPQHTL